MVCCFALLPGNQPFHFRPVPAITASAQQCPLRVPTRPSNQPTTLQLNHPAHQPLRNGLRPAGGIQLSEPRLNVKLNRVNRNTQPPSDGFWVAIGGNGNIALGCLGRWSLARLGVVPGSIRGLVLTLVPVTSTGMTTGGTPMPVALSRLPDRAAKST